MVSSALVKAGCLIDPARSGDDAGRRIPLPGPAAARFRQRATLNRVNANYLRTLDESKVIDGGTLLATGLEAQVYANGEYWIWRPRTA
jgi:hypothetical protein